MLWLQVGVDVGSVDGSVTLRATGSKVLFPGFLAAYADLQAGAAPAELNGSSDPDAAGSTEEADAHDGGADMSAVLSQLQVANSESSLTRLGRQMQILCEPDAMHTATDHMPVCPVECRFTAASRRVGCRRGQRWVRRR